MWLIDIFWGRWRSTRAGFSLFWTICSGIILFLLSALVLLLTWRHLANDNILDITEEKFFLTLLCCLTIGIIVSAFLGLAMAWYLTFHITLPLKAIVKTAKSITAGDWTRRVEVTTKNVEIDELVAAFNRMCDINKKTLDELKRMGNELSHDLNTPMTHMQIVIEQLAKNQIVPQDAITSLTTSITTMRDTISTVLDIARIESKIDTCPVKLVDISEVVWNIIELYTPNAEDRRIKLICTLTEKPVFVHAHENRIVRILVNLLDNAFKFTPDNGKISIQVSQRKSSVTISFSDTGIGIAEKDLPHVFKRFYRAESCHSLPGHGLGLALVKALVEMYNGGIEISSREGYGTTVIVTFPLAEISCR